MPPMDAMPSAIPLCLKRLSQRRYHRPWLVPVCYHCGQEETIYKQTAREESALW
jgi:hypothetical protein